MIVNNTTTSAEYIELVEKKSKPMKSIKDTLPKEFFRDCTSENVNPYPFISKLFISNYKHIAKIKNIVKLVELQSLEENWDDEGAQPIPLHIINNARYIVDYLDYQRQPRISPLHDGGLSLSFQSINGHSLIFEFYKETFLYAIGVKYKGLVIYSTGYVEGFKHFFKIVRLFYKEILPDGTTFERFKGISLRQDQANS
jgi:hypothetical protein